MNSSIGRWIRNIMVGLVFIIPIFPLIVLNSYFFPFITGKAFYFRLIVELVFAGWVVLAFLEPRYRPKLTPLTLAVSLFVVIVFVADLLGVNPLRSLWSNFERMEGWFTIIHLWGFYIVTSSLFGAGSPEDNRRMWHRFFNSTILVATIVGIWGLFQILGWAPVHQGSTRIDASLGNAAYMAVYMLIHAFLAAYLYYSLRTSRATSGVAYLYAVLALFFGILVFETATRGTMLALIGGILLSLGLYAVFARRDPVRSRWIAAGFIALIVLGGYILWASRHTQFIQKSEVLNRLTSISISDTKTQARGYVWPMALKGFTQRPIFGWGQENFNYIFNANYNPHMWNQEQWFDRAHSVFLDWLVAAGALGFISYLVLYVLAFVNIWQSTLSLKEKSVLSGLIAAYAVHNIFVFDNLASYFLFFTVLGFANSLNENRVMMNWSRDPARAEVVEYVVAPVVLILLCVSIYILNILPIEANTGLITALQQCASGKPEKELFDKVLAINVYVANQEVREQLLSCASNVMNGDYQGQAKQDFLSLAADAIKAQTVATPKDARAYALGGYFYAVIGDVSDADKFLGKAHELSPAKQSISLQLAAIYLNEGKLAEALTLDKAAYESDPRYDAAKESYIRALIANGKDAEARQLFGKSDPAMFETEGIAQIYLILKKYPQAIAIYKKLAEANPTDPNGKIKLVQAYNVSGNKAMAIQLLREIAVEYPDLKAKAEATIKAIQ